MDYTDSRFRPRDGPATNKKTTIIRAHSGAPIIERRGKTQWLKTNPRPKS